MNRVEGALSRKYPEQMAARVRAIEAATATFRANLRDAAGRIAQRSAPPVLIKTDLSQDQPYSNFDLVVGDDGWQPALVALEAWGSRERYWLEPGKLLVHPPSGPSAHLHRSVEWFGIPVVPTGSLRARAGASPEQPWLDPAPEDQLRIVLAHALFQNLAIDLSDLLMLRDLLGTCDVSVSAIAAEEEGWGRGFTLALDEARRAMRRLDTGAPQRLPAPLPALASISTGMAHAVHLARTGRAGNAMRAAVFRVPVVVAGFRRIAKV